MTDTTPVPYISEPARRIIERIAEAVFTMQRESSSAIEQADAVARECQPLFEQLGVTNEGDGFSFDEDLFADMSPGARDIAVERHRQVETEGWTPAHDDEHGDGELSRAAACYAAHASAFQRVSFDLEAYRTADLVRREYGWPWASSWWKPTTPRRDLVKAGALIVAEIDRIDRAARGASA